jgi:protein TonB
MCARIKLDLLFDSLVITLWGCQMLSNLLESKATKQKRFGGSVVSVSFHALIVAGLIVATAHASITNEKSKPADISYVEVKKTEPPPQKQETPPSEKIHVVPTPKGFKVLIAPIEIPVDIPPIDLTRPITDDRNYTGKGTPGGTADGIGTTTKPTIIDPGHDYTLNEVERPVITAPGSPGPSYPDMLRSAGVEGTVLVEFVVDTTGRAEIATFKTLKSDNELFSLAVRNALQRMRFLPAEVGGRKVRQLVQQPFQFTLNKN